MVLISAGNGPSDLLKANRRLAWHIGGCREGHIPRSL